MNAEVWASVGALAVAILTLLWQAFTTNRQHSLQLRQEDLSTKQANAERTQRKQQAELQERLAQIEQTRFDEEQQRKKRAHVVVSSGSRFGELLLTNQSEAPARNVQVTLQQAGDFDYSWGGTGLPMLKPGQAHPIVALGPHQCYPILVLPQSYTVALAVVTWEDDAGEHRGEFQVAFSLPG